MADTIRQALERLLAVIKPKYTDPDEIVAVVRAMAAARTALAAEPTFIASEPSDEDLEDLAEVFNGDPLPAMRRALELWGRPTVATLAAEPPAPAPVADGEREELAREPDVCLLSNMTASQLARAAALLRQPAPAPAPADHVPDAGNMVAADGEAEELAQWLERIGDDYDDLYRLPSALIRPKLTRAAALLREARPQPVPVADRPWERPGWCDAKGRCWWFNRTGIPEWQLADGGPYGDVCLPHWAIPQPPQAGEVRQ